MIHPPTLRARLVLEVAAELAAADPFRHRVTVRFGNAEPPVVLSNSSTPDGIADVVAGTVTLATINPSAALTIAFRGHPPFAGPQPVRTVAVMPSRDGLVFAMHPRTGVHALEDLATAARPLTIAVRGEAAHALHAILDDVLAAAGSARETLAARGFRFERTGGVPMPESAKFRALAAGDIDGIFDEGADEWLPAALEAGMTVFGISEPAVARLEALGYRRTLLERQRYPRLEHDLLTLDFSGWAVFVHAQAADDLVERVCAALDARKATIAWECRNTPDAPYDVPLHPAAERFWRSRGYLA
ncbi:MAG TPA: hypothetical protein VGP41_10055 [Candidatus Lustribacter sp.]|nr:hypothetical protein [Candidatus Lustribacter sp.]